MSEIISNPIPASQIANVEITWNCLTAPTCTTLPLSLQTIVDAICSMQTFDSSCLGVTGFVPTMQALITKACATTTTTTTAAVTYDINSCTSDGWSCDVTSNCLTANTTDPEQLVQILYNSAISSREAIKALCVKVDSLTLQVATLQLQLANGCC